VAALLGILDAGGVYVPLDPRAPAARLAWLIADTGMPVVVTTSDDVTPLPDVAVQRVCLDRLAADAEAETAIDAAVSPDQLACVLYTSGSTGTPKGVGVSHRNILRLVSGLTCVRLDAPGACLLHSPLAFDASTFEIWGPLLNGGRCVVAPPGPIDASALPPLLARHGVTTLWLTSALFNTIADLAPGAVAGVRELLIGGEPVSAPHVARVQSARPGLTIVNGYGPTEATTFTTMYRLPDAVEAGPYGVPIGAPIANTQVYVLDARQQPLPPGMFGELYVGGPGVSRGYWRRPGLTAAAFVPDHLSGQRGARLYRTGDRARWRADGVLECAGRVDRQVKVRGYRIEPGEIEAALCAHPGVREAAVIADREASRLIAYWVAAAGGDLPTVERLRAHLLARLPEYMVPAVLQRLDALPLTAHGKIDRRALPAIDGARPDLDGGYVAPRTADEAWLASVWAEVLGVERVGVHDNFFALGGHSLTATQVVSRVREATQAALPLRDFFESPTVAGLAARLAAREPAAAAIAAAPAIARRPRAGRHLSDALLQDTASR
jgi:amino acid adenylation domain-containing protein